MMGNDADLNFPEMGSDGFPLTSLPQEFYISEKWFERNIALVFRRRRLFACHISEIAEPGDFTTFELAKDSVVVARDRRSQINAFPNVCRHRGSRLCETG
ncbi:Rieske-like 2Fe-2S protein [Paraburkholderia sp. BL23I1N1]|nr:Rieske-like 2Fe-2S protein [Paraburkholderia sp. BL23I1N1]